MPDLSSSQRFENALALEDPTLLERLRRGDTDALKAFLDLKLISYEVKVVEVEIRQKRLQLSLSGVEVPQQSIFEPLLQRWIVPLALTDVSTVELYGQRDGSDLPFWRCSFNLSDVDLSQLDSIMEPEITSSAEFVDPLQIEFKTPLLTDVSLPEESIQPQAIPVPLTGLALDITEAANETNGGGALHQSEQITSSITQEQSLPTVVCEEKTKAVKDFLTRYAAGERDFSKVNLNEANLSGVNLTLANLHGSELIWTNLENANLYHINLSRAKLRHANLSGAKLRSSNLQGTDFLNANLRGADLSWSNLNGANLTGADLTDANLKNAILERVILPDGTLLD